MNIGEASKTSKVSAKMIRYYEQIGLIPVAQRNSSGYRAYSRIDVHRLHFIRRARNLGFSVAETKDLLSLWHDQSRQSADVKHVAQEHLAELDRRIESMRQMADTLEALIRCCAGDDRPNCPILHTLEQPDEKEQEPAARGGAVLRSARKESPAKPASAC
ncbi:MULTISPECIES: Cu(I)-responsive transcriptional regulator [Achromobacter]|jgi:MerR family gold-responsive transcriptional activator of gol and ges genes|uniref:Copper export regulator n=1 Tax=Achromobacter aegrifaciens TaxID=1287736 RepID=A0AAD2J0M1_ACHAE|nr:MULTISPECIES: Cu(I)-responsive transcriptional regulator [Achromobacter]PTN52009.1 Cu(I)-responsive transcriptional regulator [Achromobacter xylosoxidans]MBD9383149.1 Cu(I)-responsive transcriptional regulator [Achromobacter sp. ACM02]MBD9422722.1 Cu(I)-responsive transcriptional regulator [Achromobacter sp. ACM04]MBD9430200.1 Cu(I)-responsive transcriptional regulator [Achromobacter sp. ACM03]MBD9471735.1 Cu(I)-responsive transcriptional regulator [Achromobacter sp. ACM01]